MTKFRYDKTYRRWVIEEGRGVFAVRHVKGGWLVESVPFFGNPVAIRVAPTKDEAFGQARKLAGA